MANLKKLVAWAIIVSSLPLTVIVLLGMADHVLVGVCVAIWWLLYQTADAIWWLLYQTADAIWWLLYQTADAIWWLLYQTADAIWWLLYQTADAIWWLLYHAWKFFILAILRWFLKVLVALVAVGSIAELVRGVIAALTAAWLMRTLTRRRERRRWLPQQSMVASSVSDDNDRDVRGLEQGAQDRAKHTYGPAVDERNRAGRAGNQDWPSGWYNDPSESETDG